MTMEESKARKLLVDTGKKLLETGLVARTWGNISCRLNADIIVITPSGLDYTKTTEEDIVKMNLATGEWQGIHKPSGEKRVHIAAYQVFPDVHFVIHTHQTYASALGLAGYEHLDITKEENESLGGIMPADYGLPGTKKLTNAVKAALQTGAKVVLMKSHGVLICGGSKEETMNKAVLLEDICKRNIKGNYDLAQNTTSDKTVELLSVVKEKFKYAALVQTPAVNACANKGIPIYAQLDDMAQMIGRKIPVVSDNDVVRYIDEVRPNDLNMLEKMLKKNRLKGGTAAVILEPVGPESGTRPISKEYNMEVRKLCDKYGALLIFDEVVTGFRVGLGGAQGYFNVVPDLTIFGKIIAGGYPGAGGVGGKKEYAQLMAAGLATGKHRAYVGGTLAANPLSCLAGYTAIREIERTNACEIAGAMGDRLCDGLKELIDRYGLPYVAYNQGSIVHLECTGAMSFDFSSMSFIKSAIGILKHKNMMYERKDSMERMGAAYMANGIVTLAGSRLYTSLADTPEIIDEALNRFEEVFKHVKKTDKGKV